MDRLILRFVCDNDSYEFTAGTQNYPRPGQVTNAFYAFKETFGHDAAHLELFHEAHGWQLICCGNTYPIIRKPEALDFEVLIIGILETLKMMEQWPEPEQKAIDINPPQPREPSNFRKKHLRLVK